MVRYLFSVFVNLCFLVFMTVCDLRKRSVDDLISTGFVLFNAVLCLVFGYFNSVFMGLVAFVTGLLFYKLGYWGGADVKIVTGLSLSLRNVVSFFFLFPTVLVFYSLLYERFFKSSEDVVEKDGGNIELGDIIVPEEGVECVLDERLLSKLRGRGCVRVRRGIPLVPCFLFTYLLVVVLF